MKAESTTSPTAEAAFADEASPRSMTEWTVRLGVMLVGLAVAHLGVTLFLLPDLGSDPFTIFVQGLSRRSGLSVGTCHAATLTTFMLAMLVFVKGYVKPGTVVCSFCGGPIIDLFSWLLGPFISPLSPMPVRAAAMLAGCVVLAAGMSLVIKSDAGTGANDLVAVIFTDKLRRFQFRWVRMGVDFVFAAVGLLLGGTLHVGTLAAILLVGPAAQFFFPISESVAEWAVRRLSREKPFQCFNSKI